VDGAKLSCVSLIFLLRLQRVIWILKSSSAEGPSLGTVMLSQRFRVSVSMDGAKLSQALLRVFPWVGRCYGL
jgi:hypothetical protein